MLTTETFHEDVGRQMLSRNKGLSLSRRAKEVWLVAGKRSDEDILLWGVAEDKMIQATHRLDDPDSDGDSLFLVNLFLYLGLGPANAGNYIH